MKFKNFSLLIIGAAILSSAVAAPVLAQDAATRAQMDDQMRRYYGMPPYNVPDPNAFGPDPRYVPGGMYNNPYYNSGYGYGAVNPYFVQRPVRVKHHHKH